MSDPRFRPRDFAAPQDRRNFGRIEHIAWLEATSEAEATRVATARIQHLLACRITYKLRAEGFTVKSYAERVGIGYDRMAKVFRGEAVMRLEDVADAERILGPGTIEAAPE